LPGPGSDLRFFEVRRPGSLLLVVAGAFLASASAHAKPQVPKKEVSPAPVVLPKRIGTPDVAPPPDAPNVPRRVDRFGDGDAALPRSRQPGHSGTVFPETLEVTTARKDGTASRCLGVLVGPRVALTAGHCMRGSSFTNVKRIEGGEIARIDRFHVDPNLPVASGFVDVSTYDVAVLELVTPITIDFYPPVASDDLLVDTPAIAMRQGATAIESFTITLQPHTDRYYAAQPFAQAGDSGGPVFVGTSRSRRVIAVTSGSNGRRTVVARLHDIKKLAERYAR
jgi:hypothetical protein